MAETDFEKACLKVLEILPVQFPYFLLGILNVHGELNVLLKDFTPDKSIPHPVHFREGMTVRNAMRNVEFFDVEASKTEQPDHYFDDNWQEVVKTFLQLKFNYQEKKEEGK